ncbi:hypothetical protein ACTXT7_016529 [Hymenolepis weldensis]
MAAKVTDCKSLEELDQIMQLFVEYAHYQVVYIILILKYAQEDSHVKAGFPNSPCGMSKIDVWKASNADTPFYLATLPEDVVRPNGE